MIIISFWIQIILMILALIVLVGGMYCLNESPLIIVSILSFLFAISVLVVVFCGSPVYEDEYDRTVNLYALDSGNGVKGTFLLGSGTVRDIQYYIGYTNTEEDDYTQVKFDASNSVLRLKDDETPKAEIYKQHKFRNFFDLFWVEDRSYSEKAILYIPRDGLKNEYSVNY